MCHGLRVWPFLTLGFQEFHISSYYFRFSMSTLLRWIERPAFECLNEVQSVGDSKNAGNNQILLY